MDSLPPELHEQICSFACRNEDGRTARSLGSTSRYFRVVARPFMYHTICYNHSSQTSEHLELPRIQQLLESLQAVALEGISVGKLALSFPVRWNHHPKDAKIASEVIAFVAPTVTHLLFISPPDAGSYIAESFCHCLARVEFPELQSMTISGFLPLYRSPIVIHPTSPSFSKLAYLCIDNNLQSLNLLLDPTVLGGAFGSLQYLCFLNFPPGDVHLVAEGLRRYRSTSGGTSLSYRPLPLSLQEIYVQQASCKTDEIFLKQLLGILLQCIGTSIRRQSDLSLDWQILPDLSDDDFGIRPTSDADNLLSHAEKAKLRWMIQDGGRP